MECELTGPCFDAPEATLFLSVQHPGESNGTRSSGAGEWQAIRLRDRDGQEFEQLRWVPLGSNWPSGVPGRSPARPSWRSDAVGAARCCRRVAKGAPTSCVARHT